MPVCSHCFLCIERKKDMRTDPLETEEEVSHPQHDLKQIETYVDCIGLCRVACAGAKGNTC